MYTMWKRKTPGRCGESRLSMRHREAFWGYLMATPALVLLTLFVFIPIVRAVVISMESWDLLSPPRWVGLKNYAELLKDSQWWETLRRTAKFALMYVPSLYIMSMILALICKHIPKVTGIFRTAFFMPVILSSVVTGLIWKLMYDERTGVINNFAEALFGTRIPWLSSPEWALIAVLIVNVWMQMGYYMIIILAGLQDIPKDYYEAARIDGANPIQQFFHITIPNLKSTNVFVITMSFINSFQAYDQVVMLTKGGPARATTLAVQDIYDRAFGLYDMGYASAQAICLFIVILVITLLQFRFMRDD